MARGVVDHLLAKGLGVVDLWICSHGPTATGESAEGASPTLLDLPILDVSDEEPILVGDPGYGHAVVGIAGTW